MKGIKIYRKKKRTGTVVLNLLYFAVPCILRYPSYPVRIPYMIKYINS